MEFEGLNLDLSWYNSFEKREIKKAYLYALKNHEGQKRMTGEPYIIHPIEVAKNLILWGCDYETVCAGFLHDLVEDTDITLEDLEKEFNKDIAFIVDGVTKIKKIYKHDGSDLKTIRKLINSSIIDIRVIYVKLSDRLHNMQTIDAMPREKQISKSEETIIYYELAKMVGAFRTSRALEDLYLKYIYPIDYKNTIIQKKLIKDTYETKLHDTLNKMKSMLNDEGVSYISKLQIKNVYGLWKENERRKTSNTPSEVISYKILTDTKKDCYKVLGIINDKYRTLKVTDYISNPKPNGYSSIHDRIFIDGIDIYPSLLIKIRTKEMENVNTYGITYDMWKNNPMYQKRVSNFFKGIEYMANNDEEYLKITKNRLLLNEKNIFMNNGKRLTVLEKYNLLDIAFDMVDEQALNVKGAYVNGVYHDIREKLIINEDDIVKLLIDEEPVLSKEEALKRTINPYGRYLIRKNK